MITVVACASYLPLPLRRPVWRFGYNHLSIAARNEEPYGVHVDKPFGLTDQIVMAFYDGRENHVLIVHPGGDDHRLAAMQMLPNIRVNAPNGAEAARLLRAFFAEIGFKGSIRAAVTFAHGAPAYPMLGRSKLGSDLFELLTEYRPQDGYTDLAFVSCSVARGNLGRSYIQRIADQYNLRVSASEQNIEWHFADRWFQSSKVKRNFDFEPDNWLVATPHEKELKKYLDVFP